MDAPRTYATFDHALNAALSPIQREHPHVQVTRCIYGPHYIRLRFDWLNGKTFRETSSDNGDGWSLRKPAGLTPLYHADSLAGKELVCVTEGEKCVAAVESLGLAATTSGSASSANGADWTPLKDTPRIYILPDNDKPGLDYAKAVKAKLPQAKIVPLPGLAEHEDIVQWLDARDSQASETIVAALMQIVDAAPDTPETADSSGAPILVRLCDIKAQPVHWLWPNRIALRTITMLFGPPGKGKSFIAHDSAARISTGRAWPNDRGTPQPVGGVVLLTCEDDPAMVLRPRLEAMGADLSRISVLRGVRDSKGKEQFFNLDFDLPALRSAIELTPGCRLVVIDPIAPFMGRRTDANKHAEVYASLRPLIDVAETYGVAVLCIQHCNKSAAPNALARTMGSAAFTALCRNAWFIADDPDDDHGCLFLHGKASLGPLQPGLRFTIDESGGLLWRDGAVNKTADQLFAADAADSGDKRAIDEAVAWLRRQLAGGSVLSKDLDGRADAEGIATRTLARAKSRLGVAAEQLRQDKRIVGWAVSLPPEGANRE